MSRNIDPDDVVFDKAEQPLLRIDPLLGRITRRYGGKLEINYHGRPRRDIRVTGSDGIHRTLEIAAVLSDAERGWELGNYEYIIGLAASKGSGAKVRCWSRHAGMFKRLPEDEKLERILASAWERLSAVKDDDLRLATFK